MKFIYNIFLYFFLLVNGVTNKKKFIILIPKFLAVYFKKILIFNMLKKRIFIQHVRDINDIDTAYEIFGNENYGITKLAHWDQIKKKNCK